MAAAASAVRRSRARSQVTRRLRPRSGKEAVQMERIIRRISRAGERVLLSFFVASRVHTLARSPIRYLAPCRAAPCDVTRARICVTAIRHLRQRRSRARCNYLMTR